MVKQTLFDQLKVKIKFKMQTVKFEIVNTFVHKIVSSFSLKVR